MSAAKSRHGGDVTFAESMLQVLRSSARLAPKKAAAVQRLFVMCTIVLLALKSRNNLVDPASSHMLVLKIKPCMSKYKLLYGETANGSLKQL